MQGERFALDGDETDTKSVSCPEGTTAIGGGALLFDEVHCYNAGIWRTDERTYEISAGCFSLFSSFVTPEVICLRNS